jgi:hypothetical protein
MPITDQTPDVILFDSNGVEMNVANGVAIPANTRGLIGAGRDQTGVARFLATNTAGQLAQPTYPSFSAAYDRIAPAAGKFMATLFNTSATRKVVIQRIFAFNWQIANSNDVILDQEVRRITARTVGTSITPTPDDSTDVLSAGITADTNSSAVTQAQLLKRLARTSSEADVGGNKSDWLKNSRTTDALALIYEHRDGMRGWTLRQNQGITILNINNITSGGASYVIDFTDEPA